MCEVDRVGKASVCPGDNEEKSKWNSNTDRSDQSKYLHENSFLPVVD